MAAWIGFDACELGLGLESEAGALYLTFSSSSRVFALKIETWTLLLANILLDRVLLGLVCLMPLAVFCT